VSSGFPVAYLNEQAMEIRLLVEHRNDLVAERTRTVNRLRWHLLEPCPELEASLTRKALNQPRTLDRVERQLRKLPTGAISPPPTTGSPVAGRTSSSQVVTATPSGAARNCRTATRII
jgi:hypothetical protein